MNRGNGFGDKTISPGLVMACARFAIPSRAASRSLRLPDQSRLRSAVRNTLKAHALNLNAATVRIAVRLRIAGRSNQLVDNMIRRVASGFPIPKSMISSPFARASAFILLTRQNIRRQPLYSVKLFLHLKIPIQPWSGSLLIIDENFSPAIVGSPVRENFRRERDLLSDYFDALAGNAMSDQLVRNCVRATQRHPKIDLPAGMHLRLSRPCLNDQPREFCRRFARTPAEPPI